MSSWLRDWAALMRVANWPTVMANVVGGVAVAASFHVSGPIPVAAILDAAFMLVVGMLAIYAGAMVANDAIDAPVDRVERPDRPIASGRVSHRRGLIAAIGLGLAGIGTLTVFTDLRVVLTGAAVCLASWAYNLFHTRSRVFTVLPAACRGGVVAASGMAAGATLSGMPAFWAYVAAVIAAVVGLSLYARHEVQRGRVPRVALMLGLLPLIDAAACLLVAEGAAAGCCVVLAAVSIVGQRIQPGT